MYIHTNAVGRQEPAELVRQVDADMDASLRERILANAIHELLLELEQAGVVRDKWWDTSHTDRRHRIPRELADALDAL